MLDFMTRPLVSDYYQLRIFGVEPIHVFPLYAYRAVCFDVCIAVCLSFVCWVCLSLGYACPVVHLSHLCLMVCFSLCLSRRCLPLHCLVLCLCRRCLPLYCLVLCLSRRCLPLCCLLLSALQDNSFVDRLTDEHTDRHAK